MAADPPRRVFCEALKVEKRQLGLILVARDLMGLIITAINGHERM